MPDHSAPTRSVTDRSAPKSNRGSAQSTRPAGKSTRLAGRSKKRRTTLTLPEESLAHAERIARARNINLSAVVSEALAEGLRMQAADERSKELLDAFRKPFEGLSDDEVAILDGVILEPRRKR
jgi:post-segregation antitoxin (ccd killing protein)